MGFAVPVKNGELRLDVKEVICITGFVYKISNDINKHVYIGQTILPIEDRFREHTKESQKYRAKNRPLYNAMRKYGAEHFSIALVEECDYSILSEREQYWIDYYNSYKDGYNATRGGDGSALYDYDSIIEKYKSGMTIREISEYFSCDRDVAQRALKRAKINPYINGIKKISFEVSMFDKEHKFIKTFSSYQDAARWLIDNRYSNASPHSIATNIGRVVEGKRKTCCGFIWSSTQVAEGTSPENSEAVNSRA